MADFWEPWQPQVGDAVRIRPSAECWAVRPSMYGVADPPSEYRVSTLRAGPIVGHLPPERFELGRVVGVDEDVPNSAKGHRYLVQYDAPVRLFEGVADGTAYGWYPAQELERALEDS